MLQKLTFFGATVWCVLVITSASGQNENFTPIRDAMKTGNAKEVAKYFDASVDISFDGISTNYSKDQAEFVLREFFKKHPPTDLVIVHSGSSKGGSPFVATTYKSNNENYDLFIRVREMGKAFLIHDMMFDKE